MCILYNKYYNNFVLVTYNVNFKKEIGVEAHKKRYEISKLRKHLQSVKIIFNENLYVVIMHK